MTAPLMPWGPSDTARIRLAAYARIGGTPTLPSRIRDTVRRDVGLAELKYRRLFDALDWLRDRGYAMRQIDGWTRDGSGDRTDELRAELAAREVPRADVATRRSSWDWSDTVDIRISTYAKLGRVPKLPSQIRDAVRRDVDLRELGYRRLLRALNWLRLRGYCVRRADGWCRVPGSEARSVQLREDSAMSHPMNLRRGAVRRTEDGSPGSTDLEVAP